MSKRPDMPRIPSDDKPSLINSTMGKWAFWTFVPTRLFGKNLLTLGAVGVFGLVGGAIGKQQRQEDQKEGKVVSEPTFWNKNLLSNFMAVWFPVAATTVGMGLAGKHMPGIVSILGTLGAFGAGIYGGVSGKHKMRDEFNRSIQLKEHQAAEKAVAQKIMQGAGPAQAAHKDAITPEEAQLLESRTKQPGATEFASAVQASKETVQEPATQRG